MKCIAAIGFVGLSLFSFSSFAQEPTSSPTSAPSEPTTASLPPPKLIPVEEEGGVSYGAEVDFNSVYGWRGIVLSSGPVAQPSAWASVAGATVSGWASFTANGTDGFGTFQEFDFIAEYELEAAGFALIPRAIAYVVPGGSVGEVELELDHALAGPLSIYQINSIGFFGTPGSYFGQAGFGFAQDFDFGLSVEANIGIGVGNKLFNEANLARKELSLNALLTGLAASYYFLDGLMYARLHAEVSDILDGTLNRAVAEDGSQALIVNGGLAIGFEM